MKLRTKMVGPDSTSKGPYPSADDDGQALLHDAACAHALMLAQDEFWKQDDLDSLDARDAVEMIGVRASEIMAEWGFDNGEVE
jgi:hypothetical protein